MVFGLGFDTATEVALLATTALLASQHIPWYAIICLLRPSAQGPSIRATAKS